MPANKFQFIIHTIRKSLFHMNTFANIKEWAAAQTISCGWEQRVRGLMSTLKPFTVLLLSRFLVTVLFFHLHPQYGLFSYSEILCPLNPLNWSPEQTLFSSSWPLVSRTSSCWSTRGAEGCRWREESSRQTRPSPARERTHLKVSEMLRDGPKNKKKKKTFWKSEKLSQ